MDRYLVGRTPRFCEDSPMHLPARLVSRNWFSYGLCLPVAVLFIGGCGEGDEYTPAGERLSDGASVAASGGADPAAIGRCALNATNGVMIGEIFAIETNPANDIESYRIQDLENERSKYYMNPSNVRVVDCSGGDAQEALENEQESKQLVGKCAYNPSDRKYLGRVIRVGPEGVDSWGDAAAGQRSVTVNHPEAGPLDLTYPRHLIVEPCP